MDTKTDNQQSIFNELDLLQRLMGDTSLEKSILAAFLTEIPELILTLKQSIHDGNIIHARLQAHTIRGAAANLSAGNLRTVAETVEESCKKQDLDGCLSGVTTLEAEFHLFTQAIRSLGLLQHVEEKV